MSLLTAQSATGPERSRTGAILLVALAALAVAFSAVVVGQRYWLDDSFISFRYARNLVDGHGLVYNPGDPVEGYTNFLWTLVSAAGLVFAIEPIHFTQAVSLGAQALTLWALWQLGRTVGHRGLRPLFAPLFLAGSIGFLAYPMTGMETSFFTLLVTLAVLLIQRRAQATWWGGLALGLVLLGIGLTRFDGFVVVILLVSWTVVGARVCARRTAVADVGRLGRWFWPLGVFVLGLAAYNLWRIETYPTPLPNTFYAKTSFNLQRLRIGFLYLKGFALGPGVWAVSLALLPFLLRQTSAVVRLAGWVVLGQAGYVAIVGGDWMPHYRFLMPVLPLVFLLMQEGFLVVAGGVAQRLPSPRTSAALVVGVLFGLHLIPLYDGREFSELAGKHFDPHDARRIGEFLAKRLPEDQLIAMEWGGIIPYYAPRHRALDTYGLTDRAIVQEDFPPTVWGRKIPPGYLQQRAVDLVAPCARLMPTRDAALASVEPGGPNHYSYYPTLNDKPKLGYRWRMFQVAPNAWWPALVKR